MRNLETNELQYVSGAGSSPTAPGTGSSPSAPSKGKMGNNGFGNGADANRAAPGNSGMTGGGKENSVGDDRGER